MVAHLPSCSLSALPFSTDGFYFMVQDCSGAAAVTSTFRDQEGKVGRGRLTSSFKVISQDSHDTLLTTTHWTALCHLAISGSKKLKNVDFVSDNYWPSHTSGVLLLRKKGRKYIERTLAESVTGGNTNNWGSVTEEEKGTKFLLGYQKCVLQLCLTLWIIPGWVSIRYSVGHPVSHTHF